jgi:hypothetical protein
MMKVPKGYLSINFQKTGAAPYAVQTNLSSRKKGKMTADSSKQ